MIQEVFGKARKIFQKQHNFIPKFIVINIAVFLLLLIVKTVCFFIGLPFNTLLPYISLSTDWQYTITVPWVIVSYPFVQLNLFHCCSHMLLLYSLGTILSHIISHRQIQHLLVLGIIFNAIFVLFLYHLFFPYLQQHTLYGGISGSIYTMVAVIFFLSPQYTFRLLFFGAIPFRYIFYCTVIWLCLSFSVDKAVYNVVGLASIVWGYLYSNILSKKKQGKGINFFKFFFKNAFKSKKNKLKIIRSKKYTAHQQASHHTKNIDNILEKIEKYGYVSLTQEEKYQLFSHKK